MAAFTRVTPFARRVSRSFLLPFSWYRVTGSPLFSFPSSTRVLYLVLWWRVQRHCFNSLFSWFFSSYGDDDGVAVLFTLLPSASTMHGAFRAAFLFQAFVTLKRLFPGKLGVSFMRRKQSLWSFNFVISGEKRGETPIRFSFSSYFVFKRNAITLFRILFRAFDKETRCCAVEIEIYSAFPFSSLV